MRHARRLGLTLTTLALAGTGLPAPSHGDPVTEARSQRALSLGISEGDLPPVPRGIAEPPPLPPPEIHPKDARGATRRGARKAGAAKKKGGSKAGAKAPSRAKAKGSKKSARKKG
jgi:hypothetical protein